MEFQMRYDSGYEKEKESAHDPHFRFYDVPEFAFEGEAAEGLKKDYGWGVWRPCDPENVGYCSAVGYYFGKMIRRQYGIPVGIVGYNWGGTSASAWLDEELLKKDPELKIYWDEYAAVQKTLDMETYLKKDRKMRESREKIERAARKTDDG